MGDFDIFKEITSNRDSHIIFENQSNTRLEKFNNLLKMNTDFRDVIVKFSLDELMINRLWEGKFLDYYNRWDKYVALKIMTSMEEQINFKCMHDLEWEKSLFLDENAYLYKLFENDLATREEINSFIRELGITNIRLHFFINDCRCYRLYNVLAEYLRRDNLFITMIYTNNKFCVPKIMGDYGILENIHDVCDYKKYDNNKLKLSSISFRKTLKKRYKSYNNYRY